MERFIDTLATGTLDLVGSLVISTAIKTIYIVTYPFYVVALFNVSKKKQRFWLGFVHSNYQFHLLHKCVCYYSYFIEQK
jgi:hypothetical protein